MKFLYVFDDSVSEELTRNGMRSIKTGELAGKKAKMYILDEDVLRFVEQFDSKSYIIDETLRM